MNAKYIEKVKEALTILKKQRKITKFQKKIRDDNRLFYSVELKKFPRDITIEFVVGEMEVDIEENSSGFFQIHLPVYPIMVNPEQLAKKVENELSIRIKGFRNEKKVEEVLEVLKKNEVIEDYYSRSQDDINGADFNVVVLNEYYERVVIPLQVKSSPAGQENHKKHYPQIPSLVVSFKRATERKIKNIIEKFLAEEVIHV